MRYWLDRAPLTGLPPAITNHSILRGARGSDETPAGDTDGQGVASVTSGQVCFSILARLIAAPAAAHIHEGNAGVASGPIRVG
jgi:hypothetical protein